LIFIYYTMISKKDRAILQKFGEHIRQLRDKNGLSLRELSYRCNIDNSKISKIEQGKVNITVLTLLDLAAALDTSPMELLGFLRNN
jgi:transcriptional regulator with XRE-family HTH domain